MTILNKPLVSVLTPTWNRASYLERVWNGLDSQTCRNFEWIIANDGSTDETESVVRELSARSNFPVVLINASVHIGKPRMDNELIKHAGGEFIVWCDSDDYLTPHAIERLLDIWKTIPENDVAEYIGLTALCADERGVMQSTLPPHEKVFDTTWNELSEKYHVHGDRLLFVRSDIVKKYKYVEVDFMIIESSVWGVLSDMRTRFIPEVLKIVDRETPNRISFSGKMEYCRGKAYGIAIAENIASRYKKKLTRRLWKAITYFRYCIHGEIGVSKAMKLWDGNLNPVVYLSMYPFGLLLAIKDVMQGKVRKTHREFDQARKNVSITVETLNVTKS